MLQLKRFVTTLYLPQSLQLNSKVKYILSYDTGIDLLDICTAFIRTYVIMTGVGGGYRKDSCGGMFKFLAHIKRYHLSMYLLSRWKLKLSALHI